MNEVSRDRFPLKKFITKNFVTSIPVRNITRIACVNTTRSRATPNKGGATHPAKINTDTSGIAAGTRKTIEPRSLLKTRIATPTLITVRNRITVIKMGVYDVPSVSDRVRAFWKNVVTIRT